ncbi:BirA family biotin operon repressor/biotin-[acetyl-CoA-carboxylase] ligase [Sediminibacterium goheungense]|uniref:BirA family biotin operon repressor/biotin-[acetyl-CoA-carboxylase] ligase n=1 Tax=Sediminibacterium goheungense TaxID=1086393 RepID=A0A4R6IUR8_9BACT|nr:BirA family biotin operon repressor/biotin-[acetyl-CoA-carboxylase] ligase [Sediminibacterium goheungense]
MLIGPNGNFVKNSNSLPSENVKAPIGQPFVELSETDSTNIYAMTHIQHNMATHGSVFFAHRQWAGKGQHGKQWVTEAGQNLIMSAVIDPNPLVHGQQFHLSVIIALACHDFFSHYAGEETSIKWPNDIYWRDRKAGGILIENQLRGHKWQWSVAGIGININQVVFDPALLNPVSLKQITGKSFDPVQLAKELCSYINNRLLQVNRVPFSVLLDAYNNHLFKKGELIHLKKANTRFSCVLKAVNESGELLVENGPTDRFQFGEVSWMIE